jgi:hypothetical protein
VDHRIGTNPRNMQATVMNFGRMRFTAPSRDRAPVFPGVDVQDQGAFVFSILGLGRGRSTLRSFAERSTRALREKNGICSREALTTRNAEFPAPASVWTFVLYALAVRASSVSFRPVRIEAGFLNWRPRRLCYFMNGLTWRLAAAISLTAGALLGVFGPTKLVGQNADGTASDGPKFRVEPFGLSLYLTNGSSVNSAECASTHRTTSLF